MANVTVRRQGELMQKLFEILEKHPDGLKARKALDFLAKSVTLTEHEKGVYEGRGLRFDHIVRFASVAYVHAGWMIKDSGIWTITDAGLQSLKLYSDPAEFQRKANQLTRQWKKANQEAHSSAPDEGCETDEVPEESTGVTFEQAEDQARTDIEEYLVTMPPYDFQNLVGDLLRAMGYFVEWIAPPGRDGGVDIIVHTDPLGTQGPRIKVQVKRQQQSVGLPDLKSFMANIGQHDAGIFVCTGGFTKDAAEFARGQETKRIMLINIDKLVKLWIEFTPKLSDRAWQRLPLTPIYFLTPQG